MRLAIAEAVREDGTRWTGAFKTLEAVRVQLKVRRWRKVTVSVWDGVESEIPYFEVRVELYNGALSCAS
jgi:hypothetical protein